MQKFFASTIFLTAMTPLFSLNASAQIVMMQEVNGKWIGCASSGLRGYGDSCGGEYYDSVFIGTVVAVKESGDGEKLLTLRPEEIFRGTVGNEITAVTSQGECLPEIHNGDEWLFSLQRDSETKKLLVSYGTLSGPVSGEKLMIDRLRRLKGMDNSGMVIGEVKVSATDEPSAGHSVILRRLSDGVEYKAGSDGKGDFEFPQIPVGEYDLVANAEPNLWSGDGGHTTVKAHECRDYHIELRQNGSIGGTVKVINGDNTRTWNVYAISADSPSADPHNEVSKSSAFTDDEGHFELKGLSPGRYLIGIEIVGVSSRYDLKHGLYEPGVTDFHRALVVELKAGEKVESIDIRIPADDLN
jgi:hypothetical protein